MTKVVYLWALLVGFLFYEKLWILKDSQNSDFGSIRIVIFAANYKCVLWRCKRFKILISRFHSFCQLTLHPNCFWSYVQRMSLCKPMLDYQQKQDQKTHTKNSRLLITSWCFYSLLIIECYCHIPLSQMALFLSK